MYKPQYLNIEREVQNFYSGNRLYYSKVVSTYTGYKKKPPEKKKTNQVGDFPGSTGDLNI